MGKNKNKGKTPKNDQRNKSQSKQTPETKQEEVKAKVEEAIESKMEEVKEVPKSEEQSQASTTVPSSRADPPKDKQEDVADIADQMANFADDLGGFESDEDQKKPKEEKKNMGESEFEKVDVSQTKQETPKKVEVKDDHIQAQESSSKKRPKLTGIQAFTDGHDAAPDSPMRKKKKALGQLSMKPEVCEAPKKFEHLEKAFATVWANYEKNKQEFESFKSLTKNDLLELRDNRFSTLEKEWQKELEMHIPEGHPGQNEDLVEFNQLKSSELKDIE